MATTGASAPTRGPRGSRALRGSFLCDTATFCET
jgi:hypothetical protein